MPDPMPQFTPGFRLIDGTDLNQLSDAIDNIQGEGTPADGSFAALTVTSVTASAAVTAADGVFSDDVTVGDALTVTGLVTERVQVAAAAGSNSQANATAITKSVVVITTVSATTRAVRLPTAATGLKVEIHNAGATQVKVYPATGDRVAAASTNAVAASAIAVGNGSIFRAQNASTWRVLTGS